MCIGYLDLNHSSLLSPRFVSWVTLNLIKMTMLTITCNEIYVVYRVIYQLIDWGLLSILCAKDESNITVFQKVHLYFIHQTNPLKNYSLLPTDISPPWTGIFSLREKKLILSILTFSPKTMIEDNLNFCHWHFISVFFSLHSCERPFKLSRNADLSL